MVHHSQSLPGVFFTWPIDIFSSFYYNNISISLYVPTAIKNPREGTRSPRMGHDLKRTYDIMEGSPGHPARETAPYEG